MSICVGVFHLAEAGVLSGKQATINNGAYADIQRKYPDIHFLLDKRWVESDPGIFTSGPTGAGIDLALHVVELYFGTQAASRAAANMNYQGQDWQGDGTENGNRPLPSDNFSTGASGNWEGELKGKEGRRRVAVHIWPNGPGKQLVGTADLINQDDRDLFIDPITLDNSNLHFEIRSGSRSFDGKLNAEGTVIQGTWKQSGTSMSLVLRRVKN
jgi:hypothetical protein